MRWYGVKMEIVLAVLIIALGAFGGTQWLHKNYFFQKPLQEKLEMNKFVADFKIEESNHQFNITVIPARTDNLMLAYQHLYQDIEQIMGSRNFQINLQNQKQVHFEDVIYQGQMAIYEALAQGNYTQMAEMLSSYARDANLDSKVFMDHNNIYWQLNHGSDFSYDIISKNDDLNRASINTI